MDILSEVKKVFELERHSIEEAERHLAKGIVKLVEDIHSCKGRIIIAGMGKMSHVCAKIAATMTSLGTPAFFLHPAEALHGDLGRITTNDLVLLFSKSGESEEINNMLPSIHKIGAKTVAITCRENSSLSRGCDDHIRLHVLKEASAYNIAPTSSTTVMMVLGDALAICLEKLSEFTPEAYAVFHPGGMLGKKLLFTVADVMAMGDEIPCVLDSATIRDAIMEMSSKSIAGGVAIVDNEHRLLGVFTDGDLRRLLRSSLEVESSILKKNITEVMTSDPVALTQGVKANDALLLMENPVKRIGLLPIIDDDRKLVGILSVHDLVKAGFEA